MIRLATPSDLATIEAILPGVIHGMQASGNDQWSPRYPTRIDFAQDVEDGSLWVDDLGGIRGFVALNTVEAAEYAPLPWTVPRPALIVHRLAVAPEFRRQGVGDGLFEFAESRAVHLGLEGLRSDTSTANAGMNALFARRGWSRVGTLRFPHATVSFQAWEKRQTGPREVPEASVGQG